MNRKVLASLLVIAVVAGLVGAGTWAAFTDRATIKGNSFSTGNADLKFLLDLSKLPFPTPPEVNLADVIEGDTFDNIYPNWFQDYGLKIYNDGTVNLVLSIIAERLFESDSVGNYLSVTIFIWNDDGDGIIEGGEYGGAYTPKTLQDLRSTAIGLGQINAGDTKAFIFRFSVGDIGNALQDQNAMYDFHFDGTTTGADPVGIPGTYDSYGYNYQDNIFDGLFGDADRDGDPDTYYGESVDITEFDSQHYEVPIAGTRLVMKWDQRWDNARFGPNEIRSDGDELPWEVGAWVTNYSSWSDASGEHEALFYIEYVGTGGNFDAWGTGLYNITVYVWR